MYHTSDHITLYRTRSPNTFSFSLKRMSNKMKSKINVIQTSTMNTSNNSSETSHNNNEQMVIRKPSYCNNHAYSFFCMPVMYSNNGYQPIPMIPVPVPMTIPTPTPIPTPIHIPATTNICQDIQNLYPVRVSDSNLNNTEENSSNDSDMHIQVGQYFKDANALCTAVQMYHHRINKRVRVHKVEKNKKAPISVENIHRRPNLKRKHLCTVLVTTMLA